MGKYSSASPSIRKFPTVPSQLQPLLIVDKVPEARSFTHCVLSRPTQGRENVTKKEMQQMQQDKRDPAPCPKTPKQSVPAIFEALLTPHQVRQLPPMQCVVMPRRTSQLASKTGFGFGFGFGFLGGWEVGRVGGRCPR
ncbi:hypothetical protein BU17DRAFT_62645 [Hysterangium stoloniferum]|nr:hypothetical protein BU17DRAFT_62645 [Hysterangium stoloniferum]